jgi:hypothetical protein
MTMACWQPSRVKSTKPCIDRDDWSDCEHAAAMNRMRQMKDGRRTRRIGQHYRISGVRVHGLLGALVWASMTPQSRLHPVGGKGRSHLFI